MLSRFAACVDDDAIMHSLTLPSTKSSKKSCGGDKKGSNLRLLGEVNLGIFSQVANSSRPARCLFFSSSCAVWETQQVLLTALRPQTAAMFYPPYLHHHQLRIQLQMPAAAAAVFFFFYLPILLRTPPPLSATHGVGGTREGGEASFRCSFLADFFSPPPLFFFLSRSLTPGSRLLLCEGGGEGGGSGQF